MTPINSHDSRFGRCTAWIADKPLLVAAIILTLSAVATLGYYDPQFFSNWGAGGKNVQSEDPVDSDASEVDEVSLMDADAILVVQAEDFFTSEAATAMRDIVERLEDLDHIDSIIWMDRVPVLNIFGLPEPLFPRAGTSAGRFKAAREKALQHPLVGGQLLSQDGRTLLLLIQFDWLQVQSDEDCTTGLRQAAESFTQSHPDFRPTFQVAGRAPGVITAVQAHEANQVRYQIIGYGMNALMAIILFRGLPAVVTVALAPTMGVFWTLGIIRFFDLQGNPFNDVVLPVLLSLVGLTDGVHLMVQIRRKCAAGMPPRKAAQLGLQEVGLACGLTSLTTAIGFGSLSLANHEIVREFGWSCVLGVCLTFVAVVTVIPFVCTTWLGRFIHLGHEKGVVDKNLERIGVIIDFVLRRPKLMSRVAIVSTILFAACSLTLRPDERVANSLPLQSEAAQALRHMDQAFGGLEVSSVDISWDRTIASDSPEVLAIIRDVDELLKSEPLIGTPLSIRNLLDALPGDPQAADRMSMLELLPPPLKRAFIHDDENWATIQFRVQDLGIATYGPVFERLEQEIAQIVAKHPGFAFSLEGSAVWRWENIYEIVVDLAQSLGSAALIIFMVLAIVFRSLRLGLISIIPNLCPLAVTGTFLALAGQALELVSVCAFTVCLGIAVDDTIHFLTRYLSEREKSPDQNTAIRNAFIGVGTALIMTTIILVSGFITVMFSDSRDHRIFAAMGGLTIASALFADLFFLPALLARFGPNEPDSDPTSVSADNRVQASDPPSLVDLDENDLRSAPS